MQKIGALSNRRRLPDHGNRKRDISFKTSLRMYSTLWPNLVPRAHVPFGQHQDTELWNSQFPETKLLGLPASRRIHGLVYMASRDNVDLDTFHKEGFNTHWKD